MKVFRTICLALLIGSPVIFVGWRSAAAGNADICSAAGCLSKAPLLCWMVTSSSTKLVLVPFLWIYVPVTETTVTPCYERHDEM
jgi:hypothetical protein